MSKSLGSVESSGWFLRLGLAGGETLLSPQWMLRPFLGLLPPILYSRTIRKPCWRYLLPTRRLASSFGVGASRFSVFPNAAHTACVILAPRRVRAKDLNRRSCFFTLEGGALTLF